ncbi:MAG TPA: GTP-binding protein, partial [Alphaproteobacteria bacterium]
MAERPKSAPRCVALVGPYLSGKTTLLEQLLFAAGAITRRGSVREGNTVGDHAVEARARQMSTELTAASAEYLGESWTSLDCPGSIELSFEGQSARLAADVAVVVAEPAIEKAVMSAP